MRSRLGYARLIGNHVGVDIFCLLIDDTIDKNEGTSLKQQTAIHRQR